MPPRYISPLLDTQVMPLRVPQPNDSPLSADGKVPQGWISPLLERQEMPQGRIISPIYTARRVVPQGCIIGSLCTKSLGMPQGCVIGPLHTEVMRVPQGSIIGSLNVENRTKLPQGSVINPLNTERQVVPEGHMINPLYVEEQGLPQGRGISPLYSKGVSQGTVVRPLSNERRNLPYTIGVPQSSMISPPCLEEVPRRNIVSPRNKMMGIPQGWSVSSLLTEMKDMPENMEEPQGRMPSPFLIGRVPQGSVISPKGVHQGTTIEPVSTNGRNDQRSTFGPLHTEERTVPHVIINPQVIGDTQGGMLRPLCTKTVPQSAIMSPYHSDRREIFQRAINSPLYTDKYVALGKKGVLQGCTNKPFHVERKKMPLNAGTSKGPILCIPDTEEREVPQGYALSPQHTKIIDLPKGCILSPLHQTLGLPQEGTFSPLYTRGVSQGKNMSPVHYHRTKIPHEGVLSPLPTKKNLEVSQGNVLFSKLQTQENKTIVETVKMKSPIFNVSNPPNFENMELHQDNEPSPPLITSNQNAQGFSAELLQEKMPFLFISSPQLSTNNREIKEKASNLPSTSTSSMQRTALVSNKLNVISPILTRRLKNNEVASEQNKANEVNWQENVNDT